MILFNVKEPEQQEEKPETTQAEVMQNPETMTQTAESIEDKYKVFDTMSEDWGSDDLEGFVFYDLPEKYADKGYFPEKMQIYTRCLCKQNDVPYALILAIIEYESGYEFDKTGDNGNSKGYMQIYEKWHTDRMQKLNCTDLMNPYQNVKVGIDFLSYLLKKYGTVQDALAAYNYGERGAREHLWNNGVYVYSYNTAIMQRINLRELYPDIYKKDTYLEVTDEVQAVFLADKRAEARYLRQMYNYKAHYSLDCDNGIEKAIVQHPPTPEEILEDKQLRDQLYAAVMELPDKQAKWIYARFYLGMTVKEIAQAEDVDLSWVYKSIKRGLKCLGKNFKNLN